MSAAKNAPEGTFAFLAAMEKIGTQREDAVIEPACWQEFKRFAQVGRTRRGANPITVRIGTLDAAAGGSLTNKRKNYRLDSKAVAAMLNKRPGLQ
jgi:hypothetical protein